MVHQDLLEVEDDPLVRKLLGEESTSDEDALETLRDIMQQQDSSRDELEAQWLSDIRFKHGNQYENWDLWNGRPFSQAPGARRRVRMQWNFVLRIVQDIETSMLQNTPKRKVQAKNGDWSTIQAARAGSMLCSWSDNADDIKTKRRTLITWMGSTGNAFLLFDWDNTAGPSIDIPTEDGLGMESVHVGAPKVYALSPMAGMIHPHAKDLDESPYFVWEQTISRDEAKRLAPQHAEAIDRLPPVDAARSIEVTLLSTDLGRRNIVNNSARVDPKHSFVKLFRTYLRPCEKYPQGALIWTLGSRENQELVVFNKPNPYVYEENGQLVGGIPVVHFGQIPYEGRFWCNSWLRQLRTPQEEVNRRSSQTVEWANVNSNAPFMYPESFDGFAQNGSNEMGRQHKGPDQATWLPQYAKTNPLPDAIVKSMELSLSLVDRIVAPFGGGANELPKNVTSGLQLGMYQEQMREKLRPLVDMWESGWSKWYAMYLRYIQKFWQVEQQISYMGANDKWRADVFNGEDLSSELAVDIVEFSTMPTSQMAALGMHTELYKAGIMNPLNPRHVAKTWRDMKWGDMQATEEDFSRDQTNADSNIEACRDPSGPGPVINPEIDDLQTHEEIYRAFMKEKEFRDTWDMMAQRKMTMLHAGVKALLVRQQAEAMYAQMAMEAGMPGGPKSNGSTGGARGGAQQKSAQAIGPGAPAGGAASGMTSGFGGAGAADMG